MSEAIDSTISEFRMTAGEVKALLSMFLELVRRSRFSHPLSPIKIAALGENAITALNTALEEQVEHGPYLEAGKKVANALWGIGDELQEVSQNEGDLYWGMLKGMEELLKKAGLAPRDEEQAVLAPQAITNLPGTLGKRGMLARRAGCAISDLATALMKLMEEEDKTAEMTLIRRIEALSGVVISAAADERSDMEELEELLTDAL